jgi:hypothetical protein
MIDTEMPGRREVPELMATASEQPSSQRKLGSHFTFSAAARQRDSSFRWNGEGG